MMLLFSWVAFFGNLPDPLLRQHLDALPMLVAGPSWMLERYKKWRGTSLDFWILPSEEFADQEQVDGRISVVVDRRIFVRFATVEESSASDRCWEL